MKIMNISYLETIFNMKLWNFLMHLKKIFIISLKMNFHYANIT